MRKLILFLGAAGMAVSMPAMAKPGNGNGRGGANAQAGAKAGVRSGGHARTDARANIRARTRTGVNVDRRSDLNRNGVPDYREARLRNRVLDRDRDGIDDRTGRRYGGAICAPGLAKRTPACVPPGQARTAFAIGSRLPAQYQYVPLPPSYFDDPRYRDVFARYDPDDYRYYYVDDRAYVVDPRTRLIREILNLGF